MPDVLREICDRKRQHIAARKAAVALSTLDAQAKAASAPRGFAAALRRHLEAGRYGLICEIKKASPSKGVIREDFDPPALARAYETGGASCLSVLTDEPYFMGQDSYLTLARQACTLPALRKDFMLDPYQVTEARALGADCILLIMAALRGAQAEELADAAHGWGMDVLAEIHNGAEMEQALQIPADMIGINNRNLKTLTVDLATTLDLASYVPADRLLVAESGLAGPTDLARCAAAGARCFLVGESLMRQPDVTVATRALLEPAA